MSKQQKSTRQTFLNFLYKIPIAVFWAMLSVHTSTAVGRQQEIEAYWTKPFSKCWTFASNQIIPERVASDNESVFIIPFFNGKVISLNVQTGEKYWESDLGGRIISKPSIQYKKAFIVTQPVLDNKENGQSLMISGKKIVVRSINEDTGITEWQNEIALDNPEDSEKIYIRAFESSLLLVDNSATIVSINKTSGKLQWKKEYKHKLSTEPFFSDTQVIFGTVENKLMFVSVEDGNISKVIESVNDSTTAFFQPELRNLIWGTRLGMVFSINVNETKVLSEFNKIPRLKWRFRNGAEISNISATKNGWLISSFDNFIYLISRESGELKWKRRLAGRISAKPLIAGRYAVLINTAESVASVITLETGKSVNKIILEDGSFFIDDPVRFSNKLAFVTQNGISAFSSGECSDGK